MRHVPYRHYFGLHHSWACALFGIIGADLLHHLNFAVALQDLLRIAVALADFDALGLSLRSLAAVAHELTVRDHDTLRATSFPTFEVCLWGPSVSSSDTLAA